MYEDPLRGFSAIWGSSANDIFVASPTGRIAHYNGVTWETTSLVWHDIYRLWGTASNDVYAGSGYGTILHYDGISWKESYSLEECGTVFGLTGFSSRDVYAGAGSSLIHFNGTTWEVVASTGGEDSIVRLWGSSGSDLYVLCSAGGLYYYNGHNLTALPELWKATQGIYGIGGPSTDDIYLVGIGGTILRYH